MRAAVLLVVLLVGVYAAWRATPPAVRRTIRLFLTRHVGPVLFITVWVAGAFIGAAIHGPITFFAP